MASKRPSKKQDTSSSPLDRKKVALAEEERRLHEEILRRQRLIEEAPRIAKEQEKRRREELLARASRTEARFGPRAALQDPRYAYEAQIATTGRGRKLKREQRRGMFTFFVLLITFVGVAAWLYLNFLRGF